VSRTEKIKELKKYIQGLSQEKTHYKDGTTYSDIVIDGKSLCRGEPARKHENQHLRIDKIIESIGNINGKTFVDFGSSSGYMIFRLKELGAGRCVGIECIEHLIDISNKINDIEGYDVHFQYKDFLRPGSIVPHSYDPLDKTAFETFDYGICFSSVNAVCSNDDPFYEVSEWLKTVSKVVPVLFIEFSEYITNTPWEEEFYLRIDSIDGNSEEEKKENFFQIKTEEMFNSLDFIKSWKPLGITDYNRKLYRLDFE
jgi:SAM-dependent methyltransferase